MFNNFILIRLNSYPQKVHIDVSVKVPIFLNTSCYTSSISLYLALQSSTQNVTTLSVLDRPQKPQLHKLLRVLHKSGYNFSSELTFMFR